MKQLCSVGLVGLVACGGSATTGGPTVVRRDSAGVAIVENGTSLEALPVWRVDSTPVTSIGGDSLGDASFTMISGALQLPDGSIVVADGRAAEVRLFSATGVLEKRLGGRGGGPGEFQFPGPPTRLGGDTTFIVDFGQSRITLYQGAERLPEIRVTPPSPQMPAIPIGLVSTEVAVGQLLDFQQPKEVGSSIRSPFAVVRFKVTGGTLDTVLVGRGADMYGVRFTEGAHSGVGSMPVTFGNQSVQAVVDRKLYLGETTEPQFRIADLIGPGRRIVRWKGVAEAVTEEDRRRSFEFDSTLMASSPGGDVMLRSSMFETFRTRRYAERMPLYTAILPTDNGEVWLEQFARPWRLARTYLVFDSTGAMIARVELPPDVRPFQVAGDRVIARWRDEDEIEYVRVYRIVGQRGSQ